MAVAVVMTRKFFDGSKRALLGEQFVNQRVCAVRGGEVIHHL
ncbi:MAG TPA: hypothetical protein VFB55_08720 [Verrucomicrobiae bacterium]|nr:hypothetical protein [Verrucomicrobiae bacterium]